MAKATALYYGHDTAARSIEVAVSESGLLFWRVYEFNGYQNAWSKWTLRQEPIVHPVRVANKAEYANAPEYIDIPKAEQGNMIQWGFNYLHLVPGPYRLRLPN